MEARNNQWTWKSKLVVVLPAAFWVVLTILLWSCPAPVYAATAKQLEKKAQAALSTLYKTTPSAKVLGASAKAILVFPEIVKGGFIVGGQYGEGVLLQPSGKAIGYYSTAAGSYGLQAGLQKFGYALFFMGESDLAYLRKSAGWEIGVGPSVTVVDAGLATSLSTTTARSGVYAFFFAQKGLMAGLGLQGAKLTEIHPK